MIKQESLSDPTGKTVSVSFIPTQFVFVDGKLRYASFRGFEELEVGPTKDGPFIRLKADPDVFENAFGKPVSETRFRVTAP
jgi:hypothetical protein